MASDIAAGGTTPFFRAICRKGAAHDQIGLLVPVGSTPLSVMSSLHLPLQLALS
jgi:hypothetical protein